jgi:hypothetical protein
VSTPWQGLKMRPVFSENRRNLVGSVGFDFLKKQALFIENRHCSPKKSVLFIENRCKNQIRTPPIFSTPSNF